jgi:hypothetical protein
MAVLVGCGTADLQWSVTSSRRHATLPFLREQRDLAREPMLLPHALSGDWGVALSTAEQFLQDWVASGRPPAPGRAPGPCAVAMVHGMRHDLQERRRWLDVTAALRGVPRAEATSGSGYGAVLDALLALHLGEADRALALLSPSPATGWYARLFRHWSLALGPEAAVLAGDAKARNMFDAAQPACAGSPVLASILERARCLAEPDFEGVARTAEVFARLGVPYQAARSLVLAGAPHDKPGRAAMGALAGDAVDARPHMSR